MTVYKNLDGSDPKKSLGDLLKWQLTRPRRKETFATPRRANDGAELRASAKASLTWIGGDRPNLAYEPTWFMKSQHIGPEDAGRAFEILDARTFVAMHWGTFQLTDEPLGEPPERIRAWFGERAIDEARLWVMDIGETRWLRT